jgi:trehalose 6-phosphate phosphatase
LPEPRTPNPEPVTLTPPPRNRPDWALFLDVDGTLIEIASTPQGVCVSEALKELLLVDARARDGALALVSGRSLVDIDALFAPLQFAAAGQHGLERRDTHGQVSRVSVPAALLHTARIELSALVATHPGLLLEDKGTALALHFRLAPELESLAHAAITEIAAGMPEFHVQAGKCVWELKPCVVSKGTAVQSFMTEAPFAGRIPVFAGDDLTDEYGFRAANELGGVSILVGSQRETQAQFALASVAEVLEWIAGER